MGDFVNIKLNINGEEKTLKVEKGVTFENNGAKYFVDSNGKLQKQDKKANNNIWSNASEIKLTKYQYSVFCAISDNDGDSSGLSKKDIEKELPNGYSIESTNLNTTEKQVSLEVRNEKSGALLTFGITNSTKSTPAQNNAKADTTQKTNNKPETHTVKQGETLSGIAQHYGIALKDLMAWNGIKNANAIQDKQVLKLTKDAKVANTNPTAKQEVIMYFLNALGEQETKGQENPYQTRNYAGYVGRYQMGEQALADMGIYKKPGENYNNDWTGIFVKNKYKITSLSDFLNSPEKQDALQIDFQKQQWKYIKNLKLNKYVGKKINGTKITKSGLLAGAHLVGVGKLKEYLQGNYNICDGSGTLVSSYIKKFANYDVSSITN